MKKKLFLLFALFTFSTFICQTSIQIGEYYVFKVTTQMYQSDVNGHIPEADSIDVLSPVGGKFLVVNETSDSYVIQFSEWEVAGKYKGKHELNFRNQVFKANQYNFVKPINNYDPKLRTLNNDITPNLVNTSTFKDSIKGNRIRIDTNIKAANNVKFFVVRKNNFDKKIVSIDEYSKWVATSGTLVFPFKLRPQTGDFTKDITISGVVGFGYKFNKNNILNLILGIGLASVTLDSLNTGGKVNKSSDRAAMSLSSGLVYQYKQIQLGLIVGWDFLNRSTRDNWIYNDKTWISIGVGINIFKTDDKTGDKPKIANGG